jgi:hypothetical protein
MELLAIYICRFAAADLARSALPDAPVRPDRAKRRYRRQPWRR